MPSPESSSRRLVCPPACQPVERLQMGEDHGFIAVGPPHVALRQPLDEFPIFVRKQLLLVRRPIGQIRQFSESFELLTRSWTRQAELDCQAMKGRIELVGLNPAEHAQRSPRRVQVLRSGWKQPVFEVFDQGLLMGGMLDLGKAVEIAIRRQFRGERAFGPQKEKSHLLEARLALGGQQPRPPVGIGEIPA